MHTHCYCSPDTLYDDDLECNFMQPNCINQLRCNSMIFFLLKNGAHNSNVCIEKSLDSMNSFCYSHVLALLPRDLSAFGDVVGRLCHTAQLCILRYFFCNLTKRISFSIFRMPSSSGIVHGSCCSIQSYHACSLETVQYILLLEYYDVSSPNWRLLL